MPEQLTAEMIEEFRRLESGATKGPWELPPDTQRHDWEPRTNGGSFKIGDEYHCAFKCADAALIVFLRNHAPALLARLADLERLLEATVPLFDGLIYMANVCPMENTRREEWHAAFRKVKAALAKLSTTTGETK